MLVRWVTAFLDFPASGFGVGTQFWSDASGLPLSATRGDFDEFATLVSVGHDEYLRVQRVGESEARVHLDLHSMDRAALEARVNGVGAEQVFEGERHTTWRSPGGLLFCLVQQPGTSLPSARRWPRHVSLIDEVHLEVPGAVCEEEAQFWSHLWGVDVAPLSDGSGFGEIVRPDLPLRLVLHEDASRTQVHAYLGIATDDVATEVRRLRELGAATEEEQVSAVVMRCPDDLLLRVSDRSPAQRRPQQHV